MSDKDMTCLFCGRGGVRVIVVDEVTDAGCEEATVPLYAASCPYCGARGPMALSEDEAVEAWNSRAERTCRVEVERRKFSQTQTAVVKSCSECGFEFGVETESSFPFEVTIDAVESPNFCPNCGARVVEEASDDADR